ncbi:MAG: cytosolic protein [Acidobacteria bacterium]|nr:cytosolic protein [Acidobacteriota bacterium]MBI3422728.1 cytosolic protein [Acidobacteriota bacterium]
MNISPSQNYNTYLSKHVTNPLHQARMSALNELSLTSLLMAQNPYLLQSKKVTNIKPIWELVKALIDAFLFSQEEVILDNLLKGFAIQISKTLYGGFKSSLKSVDLEFERDGLYHIVGIKSGTNWGNSDQINRMRDDFKTARELLRERGLEQEIIAVNGCIYGKDRKPFKTHQDPDKQYFKYAGQEFWRFISGDDQLYREIITPIDQEARQKDEVFKKAYAAKINEMTQQFSAQFMTPDNQIDWLKLIDFVSKREAAG